MTIELNDENFMNMLSTTQVPILVDFWASWCQPCRAIAPIIDDIARTYDGKLCVGKVDVDANSMVTGKYHIMSIPTLMIFKDGVLIKQLVGAVSKERLIEMVDSIL